ncbi:MAG: Asp-tRNA(Asn)/Glu-tRNA(Gln) amidotransferase subunit GatA [Microgenomates group bacterium]
MGLLGKSVLQLNELIWKKKLTPDEIWEFFLKRINKINPQLNAFITIAGNKQKGIPIAIKDNFCTKGIKTTAGSKVLENFIPPYESTVTKKLLDANFFIIGKTNMDAWAHGSSTETSDFGPTKNPWDLTRVAGGSSGGSAAVVSSYLAPASIGSETAGSIRGPAAWCGVVGLKPTYGRVSRYGLIAMGSSLDCPGPFTLNVEDAAYILKIISGKDPFDATTSFDEVKDYLSEIKKPMKKIKIGINDEYFKDCQKEVAERVWEAIKIFQKLGHEIKRIKLLPPKHAISVYTIVQRSEVSSNLSRYDGIRYANDRTYFGQEAKKRIMLGTFTLSYGYYDAYYKKAQKVRTLIINDFKKVFNKVDVIIAPTMPNTAMKIGDFKKYPFFGELMDALAEPSSIAGLPAINLPVGFDENNLPIGMQIIGQYFKEEIILNLAYQFEKETDYFGVIKKGVKRYAS